MLGDAWVLGHIDLSSTIGSITPFNNGRKWIGIPLTIYLMRSNLKKKAFILAFNLLFFASVTVFASGGGGIIPGSSGGVAPPVGCGTCTVSSTAAKNDGRCFACQDDGDSCIATWGTAPKCATNI
jgi:hypothetical protein